ncbi:MAG TPA: hypothetical protein VKY90_18185 [Candidatus Dormibacteraeota bacterium]|nr:hypothetical protein [Candidatus Dormibacteraeota bacterium]
MRFGTDPLVEIVVVAAIVVFAIARQLATRPIDGRRLWLVPLAALAWSLSQLTRAPSPDTTDLALLALQAVVVGGLGLARGLSLQVWMSADGTPLSRGTLLTLALWIVSFAARLVATLLTGWGGPTATAELLLLLGITFGVQNAVVWARMQALPGVGAGRRSSPAWRR